jgi:hypothetical protein
MRKNGRLCAFWPKTDSRRGRVVAVRLSNMSDARTATFNALRRSATDADFDLDGHLEALIGQVGWPDVRDSIFAALEAEAVTIWAPAAAALWCAVLDKRDLDADLAIALVYFRLSPDPSGEDNLAWSIASRLKGVSYLSSYDPRSDPQVRTHLERLRSKIRP